VSTTQALQIGRLTDAPIRRLSGVPLFARCSVRRWWTPSVPEMPSLQRFCSSLWMVSLFADVVGEVTVCACV
jgi:hypothetical protein